MRMYLILMWPRDDKKVKNKQTFKPGYLFYVFSFQNITDIDRKFIHHYWHLYYYYNIAYYYSRCTCRRSWTWPGRRTPPCPSILLTWTCHKELKISTNRKGSVHRESKHKKERQMSALLRRQNPFLPLFGQILYTMKPVHGTQTFLVDHSKVLSSYNMNKFMFYYNYSWLV